MEEDADTRTTIIVTKLPGSALLMHLCLYWLWGKTPADGE